MRLFRSSGHAKWQEDLSAYVDARLEPAPRQALERHLEECDACRQELEELRSVVALLRRVPQVSAPRSFELTAAPTKTPWWGVLTMAPIGYSTAVAALLLMGIAIGDLATGQAPTVLPGPFPEAERQGADALTLPANDTVMPAAAPAPEFESATEGASALAPIAPQTLLKDDASTSEAAPPETVTEEPRTADTVFRMLEVALIVILVFLATLIVFRWRLSRSRY